MFPGATVVVVVGDPVRRAISNYRFSADKGNEDLPPVEAMRASASGERAWDQTRFCVSPYAYLTRGRYVFEELVTDLTVIAGLYERLAVDATYRPNGFVTAVNASEDGDRPVEPELETRTNGSRTAHEPRVWFLRPAIARAIAPPASATSPNHGP